MKREKSPYAIDFEEYIREGEPDKKEKSIAWSIATGLQQVDGLTPSAYLYETAKRNIEGEITIEEARELIDSYYESKTVRTDDENYSEEADKVSARIVQILRDKTFNFSPASYIHIHRKIFEGIFKFAGKTRTYNITKKEWVLNGDTVYYSDWEMIKQTLEYDFSQEANVDYNGFSDVEAVKHFTRFIANLWQIHAFGEGNTRTTAVFAIKYLRKLGYATDNKIFEKHSWYFRNALVRANYSNASKGVYMNTEYLERFFRNIMLGENNDLKNRYTHIEYDDYMKKRGETNKASVQSTTKNDTEKITAKSHESHSKVTVNLTEVQQYIIATIKQNQFVSQTEIAKALSLARETVNRNMKKLQEQGLIKRVGADKNGHWEVVE